MIMRYLCRSFPVVIVTTTVLLTACQSPTDKPVDANDQKTLADFSEQTYRQCVWDPDSESIPELSEVKFGSTDLNGDGRLETFVLMTARDYCGSGGCVAFLCDDRGNKIGRMTVTREPVLLSDHSTHGWKDFFVWSDWSLRRMVFDGTVYPSNPSMEPKYDLDARVKEAENIIKQNELYIQNGYQLALVEVEEVPIFQSIDVYTFSFLHYGDPGIQYLITVNLKTGRTDLSTRPFSPVQKK